MCPHARTHPAQDWPHGPIVLRCRDCGAVLDEEADEREPVEGIDYAIWTEADMAMLERINRPGVNYICPEPTDYDDEPDVV